MSNTGNVAGIIILSTLLREEVGGEEVGGVGLALPDVDAVGSPRRAGSASRRFLAEGSFARSCFAVLVGIMDNTELCTLSITHFL